MLGQAQREAEARLAEEEAREVQEGLQREKRRIDQKKNLGAAVSWHQREKASRDRPLREFKERAVTVKRVVPSLCLGCSLLPAAGT